MNKIIFLIFTVICCVACQEDLKIPTSSGTVLGKKATALGHKLRLFMGIPYAQAPVGNYRFRNPVPYFGHEEINATRFQPSCYQPRHLTSVISPLLLPNQAEINEDCLYLNIFAPFVSDAYHKLPVVVFLAGEGFDYADARQFDGSFLAVQGNVIVITVNYRVSVFGFLSVLSDSAPGNAGLFDQRMALRWIKENVAEFGGDSNKITLSGRFSGAMSAAIHAFSPRSEAEKLFHRVILQSGVPVGDWAVDKNPLNATLSLAEKTGCLYLNLTETINCLKQLSSEELLKAALSIPHAWRPILDFDLITSDVIKEAARGSYSPVDIMLGMNNNEGTLCTIGLEAVHSPLYKSIVENSVSESDFQDLVSSNMAFMYKENNAVLNKLAAFNYKRMKSSLRENFIKFCGDIYVTSNVEKLAQTVSKKGASLFVYQLSHRASFSIHPSFIKAGHGDDVLFTLALPLQLHSLPQNEVALTKAMVAAVSNFAYYGNPNGENVASTWPPYKPDTRFLMDFKADERSVLRRSPYKEAEDFFYDIVPTVVKSQCQPQLFPLAEALTQGVKEDLQSTNFLGRRVTLPMAGGIILGLLCVVILLFFTTVIATTFKVKKYTGFNRV